MTVTIIIAPVFVYHGHQIRDRPGGEFSKENRTPEDRRRFKLRVTNVIRNFGRLRLRLRPPKLFARRRKLSHEQTRGAPYNGCYTQKARVTIFPRLYYTTSGASCGVDSACIHNTFAVSMEGVPIGKPGKTVTRPEIYGGCENRCIFAALL
jgi:hypothetical protein